MPARLASPRPTEASPPPAEPGVAVLDGLPAHLGGRPAADLARSALPHCRPGVRVVLDLSDVASVDAAGLRALTGLARACRAAGGELLLCSTSQPVRALLSAVAVHRWAEVFHSRHQAVAAARLN